MKNLIDWEKVETYYNNLSDNQRRNILFKTNFCDEDYYMSYMLNDLPSDIQNMVIYHMPKFILSDETKLFKNDILFLTQY